MKWYQTLAFKIIAATLVLSGVAAAIILYLRRSQLKLVSVDFTTGFFKVQTPFGQKVYAIDFYTSGDGDKTELFNNDFEFGARRYPNDVLEIYLAHLSKKSLLKTEVIRIDFPAKTTTYTKTA